MKLKRNSIEADIQEDIIKLLKLKDWFVKSTHGNEFQFGFPDLYAAHCRYGQRWIEVKNPAGWSFTPAQMETFPALTSKNVGIWILTSSTEDQYLKLFEAPNWWTFLALMK